MANWKLKVRIPVRGIVPKVGTFWIHESDPFVYLRIDDEVGAAVIGHDPFVSANKIYSVDINGTVVHTNIDCRDFICLSPEDIQGLKNDN